MTDVVSWSQTDPVEVLFFGYLAAQVLDYLDCYWQGCASTPQDKTQLDNLRQAAEDLRLATEAAAAGTLRKQLLTALQVTAVCLV